MKKIQIIFILLCLIYINSLKGEKNKEKEDEFIDYCTKTSPKKEDECEKRILC